VSSIGRSLIEALPKLFNKNQANASRIIDILSLPRLISLELFLEGQQLSVRPSSSYSSSSLLPVSPC